jgi:c-di-GMP-binding flagellar brake protein YcgR
VEELKQLQKELVVNKRLEVTVWSLDNDELEFTFHSTILAVDGHHFFISPPPQAQADINRHMEQGLVVGVVLDSYPNPLIFYPIVHMHDDSYPGYWLRIPQNCQIEVVQRRRHVRIPMNLPIEVEYKVREDHWLSVNATTEDVSGGGLRFTCSRAFPKEQALLIHIVFVDDSPLPSKQQEEPSPPLKLPAKVVFSVENRSPKRPAEVYSIACQFADLTEQQEMIIMRECFKRELRLKR